MPCARRSFIEKVGLLRLRPRPYLGSRPRNTADNCHCSPAGFSRRKHSSLQSYLHRPQPGPPPIPSAPANSIPPSPGTHQRPSYPGAPPEAHAACSLPEQSLRQSHRHITLCSSRILPVTLGRHRRVARPALRGRRGGGGGSRSCLGRGTELLHHNRLAGRILASEACVGVPARVQRGARHMSHHTRLFLLATPIWGYTSDSPCVRWWWS